MAQQTQTNPVTEGVHSLQEAAKEKLGQAREAAAEYYQEGIEQVKKFEASFEEYVRENPVRSLLIAAGVSLGAGFLIATLIRR